MTAHNARVLGTIASSAGTLGRASNVPETPGTANDNSAVTAGGRAPLPERNRPAIECSGDAVQQRTVSVLSSGRRCEHLAHPGALPSRLAAAGQLLLL